MASAEVGVRWNLGGKGLEFSVSDVLLCGLGKVLQLPEVSTLCQKDAWRLNQQPM